ncbi:hypothetical protein SAMN05421823_11511 [Catalinimonas alkaloidigena]|uniref:Lipoprotein n=1 Tax=Catalinimonas alkaloidigena TaxID=1075417 RepID=A0A1G9TWF6_9BACT|nr:DUF6252 family protein [Catalinimonas alkaloidigena]SDM51901.1 hypothetical protein SAMN05421823_11511 [Catalinimonas alkaloidigena]
MPHRCLPTTLLISLLLLSGCELFRKHDPDEDPLSKLPPPTQEGNWNAGCLIDGYAAYTVGPPRGQNASGCWAEPSKEGTLSIQAYFSKDVGSLVSFWLWDSLGTGLTYPLYNQSAQNQVLLSMNEKDFKSSDPVSGYVTLSRYEPAAGVVSGTFAFTMTNAEGDTVRVTEGRFDAPLIH